jgi:hypothetical protein
MQRIVVKTHIDLCNNAIKNMQIEGEDMKWGFVLQLQAC